MSVLLKVDDEQAKLLERIGWTRPEGKSGMDDDETEGVEP